MEKILSTLLKVKAQYVAYREVIASKSSLEKQKSHSTHGKTEHIYYAKRFHPGKKCPC